MKIQHADNHPAVAPLVENERRLSSLRAAEQERAEQAWSTLHRINGISQDRVASLAESYLGGSSDPDLSDKGTLLEARTRDFQKATERVQALGVAINSAAQRTAQSRCIAGRDLAEELRPTLARHREKLHAAVAELHKVAAESVDLQEHTEAQGYRVPVGAIPMFSLNAWGADETCAALAQWLNQNTA